MERERIKKALKWCGNHANCSGCPNDNYATESSCFSELAKDSLALIKELEKLKLTRFAKWLCERSNNMVYEKLAKEYIDEFI